MILSKNTYLRVLRWVGSIFTIFSMLIFLFKLTNIFYILFMVVISPFIAVLIIRNKKSQVIYRLEAIGLLLISVFGILASWLHSYYLMSATGILTAICGFYFIVKSFVCSEDTKRSLSVKKILFGLFVTVIAVINIVLGINVITPRPAAILMQKLMGANEYGYHERVEMKKSVLSDGTTLYKDIKYDSKYPNNYLDIYIPANRGGKPKTTVFSLHGGGFSVGDKYYKSNCVGFNKALLAEGYIVVQVNYALSPQYVYPTQLIQANEAFAYIVKYGNKYNIDTNSIILTGDSAGALLAGQLANIQVNSTYADKVGIRGVINPSSIKCVVLNSGLVDMLRIDDTHKLLTNFVFDIWGRAEFGKDEWKSSPDAQLSRVYTNVNKNYPATYITDGNTMSFTDQNKDLAKELSTLGVNVQLNLYDKSEATLVHEYQFNLSLDCAKDNLKKELAFMKKSVGKE